MLRYVFPPALALAAGLFVGSPALAGGEGWTEDFPAAQQTAESDGKDLLMDFTGSDWCGWCIRLNEEVFSHEEFQQYAHENFVLVELDYPSRTPQSDEIKAQNAELKDRYQIRGYPTIILADAEGNPYAMTGYRAGGPEAYVEHLEELKAVRVQRDEHFAAAEAAEGLEKAQHLYEGLQAMGDDVALSFYESAVQEAMALDADNEAGIKQHYTDLYTAIEQREAMQASLREAGRDATAAVAAVDQFLAREDLIPAVRQEALATKGQILLSLQDQPAALDALEQAIAADPESELAGRIRAYIEQLGAAEDGADS